MELSLKFIDKIHGRFFFDSINLQPSQLDEWVHEFLRDYYHYDYRYSAGNGKIIASSLISSTIIEINIK